MQEVLMLLALAYLVGVPVALLVVMVRIGELKRQMQGLEGRVRALGERPSPDAAKADQRKPAAAQPPTTEAPAAPAASGAVDVKPPAPALQSTAAPVAPAGSELPPPLPLTRGTREVVALPAAATVLQATAPSPGGTPSSLARPSAPRVSVDWERWVGVRGAAVVGGIALVLAGFFFVQVAIERGWLGPAARDTLAVVVGVLALAAHRPLLARGYRPLGESVGGAGAVLVYGGCWAASRLHGLVPQWLALLVMASTTGTALMLSLRSSAQILASFALVGGFATPLLLNTLESGATTLFGYVLVLDGALIAIARAKRWIWMLPLAALGTTVIQFVWSYTQGVEQNPWVATAVLGGFAAMFTAMRVRPDEEARHRATAHAALLLALFAPFAISMQSATAPATGGSLWPLTVLVAVLLAGAALTARRYGSPADAVWAAVAAALTLGYATFRMRLVGDAELDAIWSQWALGSVTLAALALALVRLGANRTPTYVFALLSLLLAPLVSIVGATSDVPWPFTLTVAALSIVALAACTSTRRSSLAGAAVGAASGLALALHAFAVHRAELPFDAPLVLAAPALAVLALLAGLTRLPAPGAPRAFAMLAVLAPLLALTDRELHASTLLHAALLLAPGLAAAMALQREGRWLQTGLWVLSGAATIVMIGWFDSAQTHGWTGLEWHLVAGTLLLVAIPPLALLSVERTRHDLAEIVAIGAVLPAIVLPFTPCVLAQELAGSVSGVHALLLTAATLLVLPGIVLDRRIQQRPAAAILLAVGVSLAGVSLARYASAQWPTVAVAVAGGTFALFCARAGSATTAGLGAVTASATAVALVVLTFLQSAFLREPFYVPIQLTIDHALVAASLVVAALAMRRLPAENEARRPIGIAVVIALLTVLFAWVNAVVLNHYATGERIEIDVERMQARDLTLSLAWALFGGALLGVGLARRVVGLRWASLVVLLATVLKVFLYDLGALTGLARVGSFLGLAVCLLAVSLLYARVLGRDFERRGGEGDTLPPHDVDVPDSHEGGVAPPGRD